MLRYAYEKMGITNTDNILIIDGPEEAVRAINLPTYFSVSAKPEKLYNHIIFFVIKQDYLDSRFPLYKRMISSNGKLWVAWPKKKLLGTDLNIKEVIRIGYNHGLVESTNLRIDETWTALKFTRPKPGKNYNNSYGLLKQ